MNITYQASRVKKNVIASPCEYELFYKIGGIIESTGAIFTRRIVDHNHLYWSFIFSGQNFVLHYDLYYGVTIYPANQNLSVQKDEIVTSMVEAVVETLEHAHLPS